MEILIKRFKSVLNSPLTIPLFYTDKRANCFLTRQHIIIFGYMLLITPMFTCCTYSINYNHPSHVSQCTTSQVHLFFILFLLSQHKQYTRNQINKIEYPHPYEMKFKCTHYPPSYTNTENNIKHPFVHSQNRIYSIPSTQPMHNFCSNSSAFTSSPREMGF